MLKKKKKHKDIIPKDFLEKALKDTDLSDFKMVENDLLHTRGI